MSFKSYGLLVAVLAAVTGILIYAELVDGGVWYWGALIFFTVLGLAIHRFTSASLAASPHAFVRTITGTMGLRMFLGLIFILIYLIVSPLVDVRYVVYYLIVYLSFTLFEIYQLVYKLRAEK